MMEQSGAYAMGRSAKRRVAWMAIGAIVPAIWSAAGVAQKGDIEFGRYLATECLTCHRSEKAGGAIPNIFGMEATIFTARVRAYRDGHLPNPVMQSVAGRLKDDEIESLALFFAVSKKP